LRIYFFFRESAALHAPHLVYHARDTQSLLQEKNAMGSCARARARVPKIGRLKIDFARENAAKTKARAGDPAGVLLRAQRE
jgi:hypothetical protein